MEAFADAIGLRALCLGLGVVDVLNGQVKLVFMVFPFPTVLGSPVGQYTKQGELFLLEEGVYPFIEQVGGRVGVLTIVDLYKGHLALSVDKGLGIDTPDPLDRTHVVSIL